MGFIVRSCRRLTVETRATARGDGQAAAVNGRNKRPASRRGEDFLGSATRTLRLIGPGEVQRIDREEDEVKNSKGMVPAVLLMLLVIGAMGVMIFWGLSLLDLPG